MHLWTPGHSRQLHRFVLSAMAVTEVPGVSLALVQGGRVVYAEGFGVRSLGDPAPVTPRTRFMMGSSAKALTSLLIARLVDQQKLSWSTPVVDLLPEFALADPDLTRRFQLRHALSNSTGFSRRDMVFLFKYTDIGPETRLAEMKQLHAESGIGEKFHYSNYLVAAAGYAAARAYVPAGPIEHAFEKAMTDLVFRPLGMNDTCLRQDIASQGETALPHVMNLEGRVTGLPLEREKPCYALAPAGCAWSTAPDIARYLLLELGNGCIPGDPRLVSEDAILERRKKGIAIDETSWYGLGLFLSEEDGIRRIHHPGNTLGFSAGVSIYPELDLGFAILTNLGMEVQLLTAIRQKFCELAFGAEPQAEATVTAARKNREWMAKANSAMIAGAAGMLWVDALLGTYRNEELGGAQLVRNDDSYWIRFDEWGSALASQTRYDGVRLLCLVTPPWRGGQLVVSETGDLVLDCAHAQYVFQKQQA